MFGTRMKSAMRCMPWSASSSGVSFLAPRRRMLVAPLAKASETEFVPAANPWRCVAWGAQPAGRLASSSAKTTFVARRPP
jgi:hypothetical protein